MPSVKLHEVSTGPVAGDLIFRCEHCGTQTIARAITHGRGSSFSVHGFGRDDELAMRSAYRDANRKALFALYRAPCVTCGRLHPALEARLPTLIARGRARTRRSIPVALAAALVAFGLVCFLYRSELVVSGALYIATGLAAVVGGGAFLLAGWPVPAPDFSRPAPVWFWQETPHGAGWVEAKLPSPVPNVPRWPTVVYVLVGAAMMFGVGATMIGWFADVTSQSHLTVVLPARDGGPMTVRIDGKEVARIDPTPKSVIVPDVAFATIDLRMGRSYLVEVERAGNVRTFSFSPREGDRGWVVAPDATANDLCFVATKLVEVGKAPSNSDSVERLALDGDVLGIDRLYLDFLRAPQPTKPGEEKSFIQFESALRAVSCAALESGSVVPYLRSESPPLPAR